MRPITVLLISAGFGAAAASAAERPACQSRVGNNAVAEKATAADPLDAAQVEAASKQSATGALAGSPTREEMRAAMLKYFGSGPDPAKVPGPAPEILEKVDAGDHERWHLRYLVDQDEYGYAYLLLPKPGPAKGERLPLILCPHPTADIGKNSVVGFYDNPPDTPKEAAKRLTRQHPALDLVRRGFVTFAPDRAGYGERRLLPKGGYQEQMKAYGKYLGKRYPRWRLTAGKNVWDLQRAIDFLTGYEFIDSDRIGVAGFSLGAWDSIMLIGMDDRIKAGAVNSGGMLFFRPELWQDPAALRAYLADGKAQSLTGNVNVWLMLAAPRPLLYSWSLGDLLDRASRICSKGCAS